MAKLSINMEPLVQQSILYCYTAGEFKKRYLPILNLLNNSFNHGSSFEQYYLEIEQLVDLVADKNLLSVPTCERVIGVINDFINKYQSVETEEDKVEFAKEITESLRVRNTHIEDSLNVKKAEEKIVPTDFLIELKMLEPYKDIPELKPVIAALEKNKKKHLEKHGNFGVEQVQENKVIDEKPVMDFVTQNKRHQWAVVPSSRFQRLNLFGIDNDDLKAISEINSVESFRKCFESVFEKLYQKDDNGHKKRFKNRIGNSLDKAIDRIRKEMNSDKYEDGSIVSSYMAKGIKELLQFNINELESYCTHNTKQSPNKKAIVAEIVRRLGFAQQEMSKPPSFTIY